MQEVTEKEGKFQSYDVLTRQNDTIDQSSLASIDPFANGQCGGM